MAGEASTASGASVGGDIRASILSELSSGPKDDAPAEVETAAQDEAVEATDDSDESEAVEASADDDAEAESDEEIDADADEPAEEDADAEVESDPKVAKGLDQVRRAEKHARAKIEAERQALERREQALADRVAQLEQFESLAKRAKYDPTAVLRALGLTDDDFELVGHAIYSESKAAAADPSRRAAAQARLKEREKEDKATALEKKLAEVEAKLEADKAERIAAAEAEQYLAGINASIAKTPLVKHLWKADGEAATIGLQHAYERLSKAGKPTTPQHVVAEYERRERVRLEKLGVDVTKYAAPAAKTATKPGAKPAVATKSPANTNGTAKAVSSRDEIVAELAKLKS